MNSNKCLPFFSVYKETQLYTENLALYFFISGQIAEIAENISFDAFLKKVVNSFLS